MVNQKSEYESSPFRRGRPPIHDTAYIPNTDGSPVKDSAAMVELEIDPNETDTAQTDSDANLKPNPAIQVTVRNKILGSKVLIFNIFMYFSLFF